MGNKCSTWFTPPYITSYEVSNNCQGGNSPYYDGWGYLPAGMKATQKAYTTYWTHGGAAVNWPPAPKAQPNDPKDAYGIVNSVLASFGNFQPWIPNRPPLMSTEDVGQEVGGRYQQSSNIFPSVGWFKRNNPDNPVTNDGVLIEPTLGWFPRWAEEDHTQVGNICNPLNFPYCTMEPIRENRSAQVRLFDGTLVDVMDEWKAAIDRAYHDSYVNGNFDAMANINTRDNSKDDPCDSPGLLAEVAPFVGATALGLIFVRIFAPALTGSIDQPPMLALTIGVVLSGFYWMRAATKSFGEPTENKEYAGELLAVPMGWAIVNFVARRRPEYQLGMLAEAAIGGALGYFVLTSPMKTLLNETKIGAFIIGALTWFWGVVQHIICKLVLGNYDACADYEKNPDARRWDTAMIAGMLTDEIRSTEGWSREDPRSEFAFKALMTGPHMHDAARVTDQKDSMYYKVPVNPMGSIYAPDDLQMTNYGRNWYSYGVITGWDGDRAGLFDTANNNLFACQSWNALRYAQEEKIRGNKDGSKDAVAAVQIKSTFDDWVQTVREAALNPNALDYAGVGGKTGKIKGWSKNTYEPLPEKGTMTTKECEDFINSVASAADAQARWSLLSEWQDTYNPCKDATLQAWLEANIGAWQVIADNPAVTVSEMWTNFYAPVKDEAYRAQLIWWASAGDAPSVKAFWFTSPPEAMVQAVVAFKPKPGLPYGNWYAVAKTPAIPLQSLACARAMNNMLTNSALTQRGVQFPDCISTESGDIGSWVHYNYLFYGQYVAIGTAEDIIRWLGNLVAWANNDAQVYSNMLWAINTPPRNPNQTVQFNTLWQKVPWAVHAPQFDKPAAYPDYFSVINWQDNNE